MKSKFKKLLQVIYLPLHAFKRYANNPRAHSPQQIAAIVESIKVFGFLRPILIDKDGVVIAGHALFSAAEALGMKLTPAIRIEHLSPSQVKAYRVADDRLAELSTWDMPLLAIEIEELLRCDLDFELPVIGFDMADLDMICQPANSEVQPDPEDVLDPMPEGPAITQPGDVWLLNKHRILCGNSLEDASYKELLAGEKASLVFSDAPYNVKIHGHASGKGAVHHREFAMASGEMSVPQFTGFLTDAFMLLARHSHNGSIHYQCMDFRHLQEILDAGRRAYNSLLNVCVWVKDNGGMGSLYRSQWEAVFVFRNGGKQPRNNVQLGKFGRNRTNVWNYPGASTLSRQNPDENLLALHPTVKPTALVADAILDCSARGEIVLDPFLGSGTTVLAAERTGRVCRGIEIDPIYVDTAIRRWQRQTKAQAVHAITGKTFDELAEDAEEVTRD